MSISSYTSIQFVDSSPLLSNAFIVKKIFLVCIMFHSPISLFSINLLVNVKKNTLLQVHCVWAAAEAYSAPSIVLTSHSHDGLHVFDDFREAYAWLRHNTEVDDKVSLILYCSYSSIH